MAFTQVIARAITVSRLMDAFQESRRIPSGISAVTRVMSIAAIVFAPARPSAFRSSWAAWTSCTALTVRGP